MGSISCQQFDGQMWLSNNGGISLLNYNDIECFSNRNYTQKAEAADSRTHSCQYILAIEPNVKYSYRENMHGGNLLFIRGCFSQDLPLVSGTDVTNHLGAKTPQATFGARCTQLAPKHGRPHTAQIESCPRSSQPPRTREKKNPILFFSPRASHPQKR